MLLRYVTVLPTPVSRC